MRWYGIPYPGTYVTDVNGIVIDKDFHQHHARRLSGQALLHRVLGTVPARTADTPSASFEGEEIQLTAYLADPALSLEVITSLVCRLRVAPWPARLRGRRAPRLSPPSHCRRPAKASALVSRLGPTRACCECPTSRCPSRSMSRK